MIKAMIASIIAAVLLTLTILATASNGMPSVPPPVMKGNASHAN